MKVKKVFFWCILLFPLTIVIFIFSNLIFNIIRIKNIDYRLIQKKTESYLKSEKGKVSLVLNDEKINIYFDQIVKDIPYKPKVTTLNYDFKSKKKLIYVFGSSPLISKLPLYTEDILFTNILQKKLNENFEYNVYNFGVSSFDTFDTKQLLTEVLRNLPKPDIVIFFGEHMDYESVYYVNVKPNFYILYYVLLNGEKYLKFFNKLSFVKRFFFTVEWIVHANIDPRIFNYLQSFGFFKINHENFKKVDDMILDAFKKNIFEMINSAAAYKIPLVIITPICNLESKPFGDIKTSVLFEKGLKEKDYFKKIDYFKKAKALEFISGDIMAKPELNIFLRELQLPNVYLLDLEEYLMEKKFSFNYNYFYDAGHMKPNLHQIVGEELFDYLNKKGLLNK